MSARPSVPPGLVSASPSVRINYNATLAYLGLMVWFKQGLSVCK